MATEKTSAQVLKLPYQLASADELRDCDDMEVYSYQLRAHGVEMIRLARTGKLLLDENTMKIFNDINRLLKEFGKPTLSL